MRPSRFLHLLAVATAFGLLLVVLLAPGCGRSSLELEIPREAGGGAPPACGPATCPDGCCDAAGVCRTGRDTRACGSIGEACSDCVADGFVFCNEARVCGRDQPRCSAGNCEGCCDLSQGRTHCLSGTQPGACGQRGAACTTCTASGRVCDAVSGACSVTSCNSSNCTGCCVGDKCLAGTTASACGNSGKACATCDPGQSCDATSGGGGSCEGESLCGPDNCAGCCTPNGQCVAGHDSTACGRGGQACAACPGDQVCVPDGQPNARSCQPRSPCGPDTCAGCCVGDQCVIATTAKSCGIKGAACVACDAGSVCNTGTGTCVTAGSCNTANCPGCCVGDICAVGTQDTACGTGGGLCSNCVNQAPSKVCQAGSCQLSTCGPGNCKGCCQNNVCVLGTQDGACGGTGGGQCTDCTQTGDVCVSRTCQKKCSPDNCGGCCQSDNSCASGVANDACGASGTSCVNCQQQGSFCNGLVVPRRCNNQQSTCPASWGTCPAGTVTPVTTSAQGVCAPNEIDSFVADCPGGHQDTLECQGIISAVGDPCAACIQRFIVPFELRAGLWACAASFVNTACRRQTGCAGACLETSCDQCSAATESQCITLVSGPGAQCNPSFGAATTCTRDALGPGQLCSQFSYADFGAWLRAVGTHFCGAGP